MFAEVTFADMKTCFIQEKRSLRDHHPKLLLSMIKIR